jgi:hypothetical protein
VYGEAIIDEQILRLIRRMQHEDCALTVLDIHRHHVFSRLSRDLNLSKLIKEPTQLDIR